MTHFNSKASGKAAPVDYDAVARVASAVKLQDIALGSSRAALNVPRGEVVDTWSGDAFVGFETTVGVWEPGSSDFTIHAAFIAVYKSSWSDQVVAELPDLDHEDPPDVEIQGTFDLDYTVLGEADLSADDLESFALANGTLHAWPYWREFADSTTQRMQIPRLVIGVFKIPSSHDPSD